MNGYITVRTNPTRGADTPHKPNQPERPFRTRQTIPPQAATGKYTEVRTPIVKPSPPNPRTKPTTIDEPRKRLRMKGANTQIDPIGIRITKRDPTKPDTYHETLAVTNTGKITRTRGTHVPAWGTLPGENVPPGTVPIPGQKPRIRLPKKAKSRRI